MDITIKRNGQDLCKASLIFHISELQKQLNELNKKQYEQQQERLRLYQEIIRKLSSTSDNDWIFEKISSKDPIFGFCNASFEITQAAAINYNINKKVFDFLIERKDYNLNRLLIFNKGLNKEWRMKALENELERE